MCKQPGLGLDLLSLWLGVYTEEAWAILKASCHCLESAVGGEGAEL